MRLAKTITLDQHIHAHMLTISELYFKSNYSRALETVLLSNEKSFYDIIHSDEYLNDMSLVQLERTICFFYDDDAFLKAQERVLKEGTCKSAMVMLYARNKCLKLADAVKKALLHNQNQTDIRFIKRVISERHTEHSDYERVCKILLIV